MKLSKAILIAVLAAVLLSLSSCGTMRRAGKDLYITLISPVLIPVAAATDAHTGTLAIRDGYEGGAWTEVLAFPFLWLWHGAKHTLCVGAHVLDFPATLLFRSWSEINENGPEIQPLDYYENTWIDRIGTGNAESGTDSESGEATGK